jgi:GTPase Era involved in 16S rRNA processing
MGNSTDTVQQVIDLYTKIGFYKTESKWFEAPINLNTDFLTEFINYFIKKYNNNTIFNNSTNDINIRNIEFYRFLEFEERNDGEIDVPHHFRAYYSDNTPKLILEYITNNKIDSQETTESKPNKRRRPLPLAVRHRVWNSYIGQKNAIGNCYVCKKEINMQYYECGHIISHHNGGSNDISNLRPVCSGCNKSVGTRNMNDYIKEYFDSTDNLSINNDDIINDIIKDTQYPTINIPIDITDISRNQINVVVIGPVSCGKSTFVNTLFVKQFSDMKIKRTTMTPQVYYETDIIDIPNIEIENIKENNRDINSKLQEKYENNISIDLLEITETKYYVPRTSKLINLPDDVYLTIYDIPGLNDGHHQNNDNYYKWLQLNFHKFDVVICLFDINSALNTSDEVKILSNTLQNIKRNKQQFNIDTKLMVILNKCDDMYIDDKTKTLSLDEELEEMYQQSQKIIANKVNSIYPDLLYNIIRLSVKNAYIYRMYSENPDAKLDVSYVNEFGHNEFGRSKWNKMSDVDKDKNIKEFINGIKDNINERMTLNGFSDFIIGFNKLLNYQNQYLLLMNHLKYSLDNILNNTKSNLESLDTNHQENINKFVSLYTKVQEIYEIYNEIDDFDTELLKYEDNNIFQTVFDNYIDIYYEECIEFYIMGLDTEEDDKYNQNIIKEIKYHIDELNELSCIFKSKKCKDIADLITQKLTEYYVDMIEYMKQSFIVSLKYFKELIIIGYNKLNELINRLIYNRDILNRSAQEIVDFITTLNGNNIVDEEESNNIYLEIIYTIYKELYQGNVMIYVPYNMLTTYVYDIYLFWSNRTPKNQMEKKIKFLAHKNMVKYINYDKNNQNEDKFDNENHYDIIDFYYDDTISQYLLEEFIN